MHLQIHNQLNQMKLREKLLKELVDNGLFESDAVTVIARYEESEIGAPMKGRLDDDVSGYPESVFISTWIGVKHAALTWIDETCPQHWARALFL